MPECALCILCGFVSHNPVDFEVSYGSLDKLLQVCRFCREDLELLGLSINYMVRLERVARVETLRFEPSVVDWQMVLDDVSGLEEVCV